MAVLNLSLLQALDRTQAQQPLNFKRIDRNNNFLEYERRCQLAGGLVHIERRGGGPYRTGLPDRNDRFQCLVAYGSKENRVLRTNSHDSSRA